MVQDGKSYPSCDYGTILNITQETTITVLAQPGFATKSQDSARLCKRSPSCRTEIATMPFLVYACFTTSCFPYKPAFSIVVRLVRSQAWLAVCRKSSENLDQRTPEDPVAMDVFLKDRFRCWRSHLESLMTGSEPVIIDRTGAYVCRKDSQLDHGNFLDLRSGFGTKDLGFGT